MISHADYHKWLVIKEASTYVCCPLVCVNDPEEGSRKQESKEYHSQAYSEQELRYLSQYIKRGGPLPSVTLSLLLVVLGEQVEGYFLDRLEHEPANDGYQVRDEAKLSLYGEVLYH